MARELAILTQSYINKGMNIRLEPGKYVIAVSGGVDSIVLLNLLAKFKGVELLIAHFDHGIRESSEADRLFVGKLAAEYELPFFYEEGRLGADSSEAQARTARYKFLRKIKAQTGSQAIITAHHQDDMIETAIINLLRGTKARGLSALKSTDEIIRPLLGVPKADLIFYAKTHKLKWREDETNQNRKYLRNYVRHNLIPKMDQKQKKVLLEIIKSSSAASHEIAEIAGSLLPQSGQLRRASFINLPHAVACELIAAWLRINNLEVDKKTVERLVVGLKAGKNGSVLDINKNFQFLVKNDIIKIQKLI